MRKQLSQSIWKRSMSCTCLLLVCCMLLSPCLTKASAAGDSGIDWSGVPSHNGTGNVYTWSVVKGDGGYYFNVVGNQYAQGVIYVQNLDGSAPSDGRQSQLVFLTDGTMVNSWYGTIEGASATVEVTNGERHYTAFVPDSAFPADGFQLTCGDTVKSTEIESADGSTTGSGEKPADPDPVDPDPVDPDPVAPTQMPADPPAGYQGIVIDGKFEDWDAIEKTDVQDKDANGNVKGWDTVDHIAMVWDGDYVYLYFAADGTDQGWAVTGNWDSVTGGGTHGNGQYAIKTDLGYELLIQLRSDQSTKTPYVAGVENAKAAVNNTDWGKAPHYWEVAIPASELPAYKETISFGFYLSEPCISNVADLQGSTGGEFTGVTIDGNYSDWTYYPHTTIEYAGSGTGDHVADGTGAVWHDKGKIYAHAQTDMPAHLQEAGGEFTQAVTIKVNNDTNLEFAPRFIAVDKDGNINWNPPRQGLANGEYEYYMVSLDAPGSSKNINDLTPGDEIYGRAIVTVGDTLDSCEWEMDVEKLAKHLRPNAEGTVITEIDPDDIKTVSVQWGKMGQKWATAAGVSTGPIVGIVLCLCAVAVPSMVLSRKKAKGAAVR